MNTGKTVEAIGGAGQPNDPAAERVHLDDAGKKISANITSANQC